jgi:hypothetical protein
VSHEAPGKSDEWFTPKYIFDALGLTFDMDVAHPRDHTHTHVPAMRFLYERGLESDWIGTVWMNPPFGNGNAAKLRWMRRFFDHGDGIALTPDRTSAPWFLECWPRADLCMFIGPKVKFIRPDGSLGEQPGTGTVLWACGQKACAALRRAADRGLGVLAVPQRLAA